MSKDRKNNNAGFRVPEGYFDQLTDRVMNQIETPRAVDNSGFVTPPDYMDKLTDTIMQSVLDDSKDARVISMNVKNHAPSSKVWFIPLIAAAAIGLFMFSLQGIWDGSSTSFEVLEDQEVMEYVVNLETSMDQDAMELLFADNDLLDNLSVNTQINDDELMDYLMDEVDLNQMYRE